MPNFTVKQARRFANLTQSKMADLLGMHVDTYRKIENNPEKATVEQAKLISKVTGISLDCIFFAWKLYFR